MKKIYFILFFFIFTFKTLNAGIFDGIVANWNNYNLKVTNILINGEKYWAEFSYDSNNDIFKLKDYGKQQSSNTYCRKSGALGISCDLGELAFNGSTEGDVNGYIFVGDEKYPFTGNCDSSSCTLNLTSNCYALVQKGESAFNVNFTGNDYNCIVLRVFKGDFYPVSSTLPEFDYSTNKDFILKHPELVSTEIYGEDNKICFSPTVCYQLEQNGNLISVQQNQQQQENDPITQEAIRFYSNDSLYSSINYPYVSIGGKGYYYDEYIFTSENILYEIKLKACSYPQNQTYISFGYYTEKNGWTGPVYLTPDIKTSQNPVAFPVQSDGFVYLFTKENPLPGKVIKSLKEQGILSFYLISECSDHNPSAMETMKLIIISEENLK